MITINLKIKLKKNSKLHTNFVHAWYSRICTKLYFNDYHLNKIRRFIAEGDDRIPGRTPMEVKEAKDIADAFTVLATVQFGNVQAFDKEVRLFSSENNYDSNQNARGK